MLWGPANIKFAWNYEMHLGNPMFMFLSYANLFRSAQMLMKARLAGAQKGHGLLKKKADALQMRFRQILGKIIEVNIPAELKLTLEPTTLRFRYSNCRQKP